MESTARITAIGSYVPKRKLTNKDLEQMVDTSDEWITKRTGIKERRIAEEKEFVTDLSEQAVKNLAATFSKSVKDVDLILVATVTPDYMFPSVASQVQKRLGIENSGAIDLGAACAGFTYGLHLANALITSQLNKKILVLGAETLSKITDYEDRTSCILFGDGAGAALVEFDEENPSFLASYMNSYGDGGCNLYQTGLSKTMEGEELPNEGKLVQNGREVYKWAVTNVPMGINKMLEKSTYTLEDVNWFIPHSANMRMIESICDRINYPIEDTLTSLEYAGNTSSASIPLALDWAVQEGKVQSGENLLLYGFGGGFVECGLVIKWNI